MTFFRCQEFYESQNKKVFRQNISFFESMKYYSEAHNNIFSYPSDWSGFNIPSVVIKEFLQFNNSDKTPYDKIFSSIIDKINKNYFYLIACLKKNKTLKHEIAHGLFFINNEFRLKILKMLKQDLSR